MLSRDADYAFYLYTCNRCRGCTHDGTEDMRPVCAANAMFGFFSYSGGGKGYVAQGILEGKVKPDEQTVHVAMNCLTCGACAHLCPPGFETVSFIRDLRDHLVEMGLYLNDKHRKIIENVTTRGNPWGSKQNASIENLPRIKEGTDIALFLGCRERIKDGSIESVRKILDKAGASYGVMEDEPCCGAPLLDLGNKKAFETLAVSNTERLNSLGVERILTLCPHCASSLAIDYMKFEDAELEPEVVTLPSLVNELLDEELIGLNDLPKALTATYHDPCHLGRFMEEYDPPREVLERVGGLELVEMERTRKSALCCGAGGWMESIVPELARFAGRERIREAKSTGAESIITACSYCTDYMKRVGGKGVKVEQFADFVAGRLK